MDDQTDNEGTPVMCGCKPAQGIVCDYHRGQTKRHEPTIGRQGQVYVSLLDNNLALRVGNEVVFDLSMQDGRDIIAALRQAFGEEVEAL